MELRSKKVRKLIGDIPPSLMRWATVVIFTIFIALIATVCLIPYPYSKGESILFHILGKY